MEIIGKFLKALPEQTGESTRGAWVRGGFVIETEEQYPKQLAFSLWGEDKVAIVRTMSPNTQLKVYFNPESREYNDRWYTDLKCFRIDTFNPLTLGSPQPSQVHLQHLLHNLLHLKKKNTVPLIAQSHKRMTTCHSKHVFQK